MMIRASRYFWISVLMLMLCPSVAPWAQSANLPASMPASTPATGTPAAVASEKLVPPPSSLQRRLAEHKQLRAQQAAERAAVRKSRLRRLTGEGQSAQSNASSAAMEMVGGTTTLRLRQAARAVMGAAAAVAAFTGNAEFLAAAGGGTDAVSTSSSAASDATSTSTSSSTSSN